MREALPQPTKAERLNALRAAVREAQRLGITSVQNAGGSPDDLALFDELRAAGELQVRVYAALSLGPGARDAEVQGLEAVRRKCSDDPLLKVGAVKLMADGVIESHTAMMLEPHADKATTGTPYFAPTSSNASSACWTRRLAGAGIHAIGDGAVRMSLDALERAATVNPSRRAAGVIAWSTSRRWIRPTSLDSERSASSPRSSPSTARPSPAR